VSAAAIEALEVRIYVSDEREEAVRWGIDRNALKNMDLQREICFDFVACGLDFVAADFDFVALGLDSVAVGLDSVRAALRPTPCA
jgi:hypothetical protein